MASRHHLLSVEEVCKLESVLTEQIDIHPDKGYSLPVVRIQPVALLLSLQKRLQDDGRISGLSFRLNGSAAAYVVAGTNPEYNDLDVIVNVDLRNAEQDLDYLREALMLSFAATAAENSEDDDSRDLLDRKPFVLAKTYIRKMIKVNQGDGPEKDLWSMIALRNARGRNVEVKFVARLKRQFEFSVDSFQVLLDDFMTSYSECRERQEAFLSENTKVHAQSVWGDFDEACTHYKDKIICTDNPEAIFGGGLLKYCRLRCCGYLPIGSRCETQQLERYMCCRFFIDVPRAVKVEERIRVYTSTHFVDHPEQVQLFLQLLYDVVYRSSQCLMNKDRTEALSIIGRLLAQYQTTASRQQHQQQQPQVIVYPVVTHFIPHPSPRSQPRASIRPPQQPYMSRVARVPPSSPPSTVAPFA